MPSRIIREGFVDSESVCNLNDWAHRVYSNLLLKVDDAGRFDGRLEFLRSHLFPLGTTRRSSEIDQALNQCQANTLLVRYSFASKPYLQLTRWYRTGNTGQSRFPWTDGSIEIIYMRIPTKSGLKDFVKTSILDGVGIPSTPHVDPMGTPPNNVPELRIPFHKPEFSELEGYAVKIGLIVTEINRFFDHYESNGWKVGRNPMRDWQAAMRNWKINYETKVYANNSTINKPNPSNAGIATNPTEQGLKLAAKAARDAIRDVQSQKPLPDPLAT